MIIADPRDRVLEGGAAIEPGEPLLSAVLVENDRAVVGGLRGLDSYPQAVDSVRVEEGEIGREDSDPVTRAGSQGSGERGSRAAARGLLGHPGDRVCDRPFRADDDRALRTSLCAGIQNSS